MKIPVKHGNVMQHVHKRPEHVGKYTACGVVYGDKWWRKKPVVLARCVRQITCKTCLKNHDIKHRRVQVETSNKPK